MLSVCAAKRTTTPCAGCGRCAWCLPARIQICTYTRQVWRILENTYSSSSGGSAELSAELWRHARVPALYILYLQCQVRGTKTRLKLVQSGCGYWQATGAVRTTRERHEKSERNQSEWRITEIESEIVSVIDSIYSSTIIENLKKKRREYCVMADITIREPLPRLLLAVFRVAIWNFFILLERVTRRHRANYSPLATGSYVSHTRVPHSSRHFIQRIFFFRTLCSLDIGTGGANDEPWPRSRPRIGRDSIQK